MWLDSLITLLVLLISIPLWVMCVELLVALLKPLPPSKDNLDQKLLDRMNYRILIPAHNEAEIIHSTLSALLEQGIAAERLLVIADNCSDSTVEKVRHLQIEVIERFDQDDRGKGFALDFGIRHLSENGPPDLVVFLDADCFIDKMSLVHLVDQCHHSHRPQQAIYMMSHHGQTTIKQKIAGFAWLVKNKIRPSAMKALKLPVLLTGSGMAFPWSLVSTIDLASGNLVEDMQLGIDCTQQNAPPMLCHYATVSSDFPNQVEAEKTQRTRWEHGHLATIFKQVPSLLWSGLKRGDKNLVALALDIGVPPLALLTSLSIGTIFFTAIYGLLHNSLFMFYYFLFVFVLFTLSLTMIWHRFGRDYLSGRELLGIPAYIWAKLSIYDAFIRRRQLTWVRTKRDRKKDDKE